LPADQIMNTYEIALHQVGLSDRSTRGVVKVTGADRTSFLHGLLTNDIKALTPGRGCYAAWLTPQGRMITDMRVLVLDEQILLDVRAVDAATIATRLEQLVFSEDVQARDITREVSRMQLVGPDAPQAVVAALASPTPGSTRLEGLARWSEYENARVSSNDGEIVVARDDELGVMAYDIHVDGPGHVAAARGLWESLQQRGIATLNNETIETLRIEAGRPLFGVDMDQETIPLEAGIEERAISFSKGCYVGQEVIVRVTSRGQGRVVRRLVGLTLDGRRVPEHGDPLSAGEREIGRITSATHSPALGVPIALGYVHRDFVDPGTSVKVGRDAFATAVVTSLPFRP
jgi:folate-binding protein YgfZ